LPKKGQKSVTLNEKVYEKAREQAIKCDKSISQFVTELILQQVEVPPIEGN